MNWRLTDGRGLQIPINSSAELQDELKALNNGSDNPIIALEHSTGHFMYIGLAGMVGFLNYRTEDDAGFVSVGVPAIPLDKPSIWFSYAGSGSEIPSRHCLPIDKVYQGAVEYYEHSCRPTSISWEMD